MHHLERICPTSCFSSYVTCTWLKVPEKTIQLADLVLEWRTETFWQVEGAEENKMKCQINCARRVKLKVRPEWGWAGEGSLWAPGSLLLPWPLRQSVIFQWPQWWQQPVWHSRQHHDLGLFCTAALLLIQVFKHLPRCPWVVIGTHPACPSAGIHPL
jgi:hypothetical protein